jgi:hypothetical protein
MILFGGFQSDKLEGPCRPLLQDNSIVGNSSTAIWPTSLLVNSSSKHVSWSFPHVAFDALSTVNSKSGFVISDKPRNNVNLGNGGNGKNPGKCLGRSLIMIWTAIVTEEVIVSSLGNALSGLQNGLLRFKTENPPQAKLGDG